MKEDSAVFQEYTQIYKHLEMLEKEIYVSMQDKMNKEAIKSFLIFSACFACPIGAAREVQFSVAKRLLLERPFSVLSIHPCSEGEGNSGANIMCLNPSGPCSAHSSHNVLGQSCC